MEITVTRKITLKTSAVEVGDQIAVGKYTATCQKVEEGKALFCTDQLLDKAKPMNIGNSNKAGYQGVIVRDYLKSDEVTDLFSELRPYMVPFENGDYIRIPYFGEIFGWDDEDDKKWFEFDDDEQWPLMKERKNRIALRRDDIEWGWLANRCVR